MGKIFLIDEQRLIDEFPSEKYVVWIPEERGIISGIEDGRDADDTILIKIIGSRPKVAAAKDLIFR